MIPQFSNIVSVRHTKDLFYIDFYFYEGEEGGQVNMDSCVGRIAVTPEHMDKIIEALKDNVARFAKNSITRPHCSGVKEE